MTACSSDFFFLCRETLFIPGCMHNQDGGQLSNDSEVGEIWDFFLHQCRKLSYSTSCVMLCFDNFLQRERTILIRSLVVIRWSQSVDYVLRGQLGFPPPPFRRLQLFLTHESNGIVCINTPKVHNIQMFANLECMLIIELLINLMQFECGLCNLVHVALDIWLILSGWDIFFRSWWEKHFNF